jgi:uncharacterized protein (TIGR00255 family)
MTGFGNASCDREGLHVAAEIKSVNNRYLKLSARLPDSVSRFEGDVERLVRSRVARGTIQLSVRVRFPAGQSEYQIDSGAVSAYKNQLSEIQAIGCDDVSVADLLQLPGVVIEREFSEDAVKALWPAVEGAVKESLDHFDDFRRREGESMRLDLVRQCSTIVSHLDEVVALAPQVVADYRDRLLDRLRKLIDEAAVSMNDSDVIREVAMFADRCDINEEITRLRSHIDQFCRLLNGDASQGRKLEFIGQEMFREINTIGSKANNVTIAHGVVEMKASIERIREVLQNVE